MRFPSDTRAVAFDADRADAEDDVEGEPDAREADDAPVAQCLQQRQRRNFGGGICIRAAERQEAATHESEPDRSRHRARHRSRGADHRHHRVLMGDEMGERTGCGRHRQEHKEAYRAKAPRQRAAERQQPKHIEGEMGEIGMQQRIGDEGPDLGTGAALELQIDQRGIVALRDEAEDVDGPVLQLRRQQHPQMDHRQQDDIGRQRQRQRQDRLARGLFDGDRLV